MDRDNRVGRVRRWSSERLRRFVRECDAPERSGAPYPLLEAARIELPRRCGGGELTWRCRVTGPDGGAVAMTVVLPVRLTAAQLHDAALAQARQRHGPRAHVQVLAVDDADGAPELPASPDLPLPGVTASAIGRGGRSHRSECGRPADTTFSPSAGNR
ncbi:hypothetical protein ACFYSW_29880 [Rhodococcus aetherivorans]|uniref:hypothetical protein n=1 Tax=Rhodococcus aetherivorans TaxID=191292 RepID=UPI003692991A